MCKLVSRKYSKTIICSIDLGGSIPSFQQYEVFKILNFQYYIDFMWIPYYIYYIWWLHLYCWGIICMHNFFGCSIYQVNAQIFHTILYLFFTLSNLTYNFFKFRYYRLEFCIYLGQKCLIFLNFWTFSILNESYIKVTHVKYLHWQLVITKKYIHI